MTENRKHYLTSESILYHLRIYDLFYPLKKISFLDTFATVSYSVKGVLLHFMESLAIKVAALL